MPQVESIVLSIHEVSTMSHYMEMSFLTTYSLILIFPIFYNIGIMDAIAIECKNLKICVYDWRLPVNGMRFMH